jgi:Lon protease-like protein
MSFDQVDLTLPDDFDNVVRLFPLPNLVLFPGVIQALHVFEPRYRKLMADALATDELISMALMGPGAKPESLEVPQIWPTICLGKIVTHSCLDDGRYNLLLIGVRRARIVRELEDHGKPYRTAEIYLLDERMECTEEEAKSLRGQVISEFRQLVSERPLADEESLDLMLEQDLPLGQLLDLIGYSCGADSFDQQRILGELDVCRRAEIVLELLRRPAVPQGKSQGIFRADFPPGFSLN